MCFWIQLGKYSRWCWKRRKNKLINGKKYRMRKLWQLTKVGGWRQITYQSKYVLGIEDLKEEMHRTSVLLVKLSHWMSLDQSAWHIYNVWFVLCKIRIGHLFTVGTTTYWTEEDSTLWVSNRFLIFLSLSMQNLFSTMSLLYHRFNLF